MAIRRSIGMDISGQDMEKAAEHLTMIWEQARLSPRHCEERQRRSNPRFRAC
jgi:hypothetical protein